MDSILEEQRNLHEERERITDGIMEESLLNKPTRREKINSDHRALNLQNRYKQATIKLNHLYIDKTGQRKEAVNQIMGVNNKGLAMDAFLEKYNKLNEKHNLLNKRQGQVKGTRVVQELQTLNKGITETVQTDITAHVGSLSYEFDELTRKRKILNKGTLDTDLEETTLFRRVLEQSSVTKFTAEEGYGKYIDLHSNHLEFLNVKGIDKNMEYLEYLEVFTNLDNITRPTKKLKTYKLYLENLISTLSDYLSRVQPLYDQKLQTAKLKYEFNEEWSKGTFKGWQRASSGSAMKKDAGALNMVEFNSIEELESLGMDRLKQALKAVGLKCGGDIKQRATRLFATKSKAVKDLPRKWRLPAGKTADVALALAGGSDQTSVPSVDSIPSIQSLQALALDSGSSSDEKPTAWQEAQVYKMVNQLDDYRKETMENVRRKQGKTAAELAEEEDDDSDEEIEEIDETLIGFSGEGEEEIIYNPKNLPLDWDGKPIPYWLYKLHGLNKNYLCEICGGHSYRGMKPFQKHFAEWRHAHGMRCLAIPNTVHFSGITKIDEAQKLWNKLKAEKSAERFKPDTEEEFEDQLGNVLNKKTFDDLRRQGLC